jgi:ABC-2 type transport system permease protein
LALRLRLPAAISAGIGLIAVIIAVGALFPAVGHTIGKLNIPSSVAGLLGGANYGTITGWFQSEICSIYGPLVVGALGITAATALTAGEEDERILALTLAYPIRRAQLLLGKAAAVAVIVVVVAVATGIGLVVGVAVGGGGISTGHIAAVTIQLAGFGFATGAVALAIAGGAGRRGLASGVATAVGLGGWLINSFAPLVHGIVWLEYLSPFYYYARHDPLTSGVDVLGLVVLCGLAAALTVVGVIGFERRDLRG